MMEDLYLIVRIAGERVALSAVTIESVIEVSETTRVPRAAPHVAGLAALRSRVITLIDCRLALGFAAGAAPRAVRQAVVVSLDQHGYGLLVDTVEDVGTARPADPALGATLALAWARVATGMVTAGVEILPAIDPAALIGGPPLPAAQGGQAA